MALKITSDNIASATLSTLGGGVKITTVAYPGSVTAANPAGGETITVTGSGFNSGIIVYINNTIPCATTYINSTSLTFVAPATGVGTYNIVLYNTDGSSGVKPIGIIFSSLPTWVTASGALTPAPTNGAYSQTVSATGDGTITYSLTSGSLPTGLSLNSSTGAITGTAPNTVGTSTFTVTSSDSQNQTTSRSFSIAVTSAPPAVEYLVVAGGGGGGQGTGGIGVGGGGGAGGYRTNTGFTITSGTTYAVTIGAGGAGSSGQYGTNGQNSIFSSITSIGGGGGGGYNTGAGLNGGSGGGGGQNNSGTTAGGTGTVGPPRQGYDGGTGANSAGGGGGGAGAVGQNVPVAGQGGTGGAGIVSSITGASLSYAGGGGGGTFNAGIVSPGGAGGGGAGAYYQTTNSIAGTNNTGGGGGGGIDARAGASGGSGIVIIRYEDTYPLATSTTGSPTVTNPTGYRVYTFTASGSITF